MAPVCGTPAPAPGLQPATPVAPEAALLRAPYAGGSSGRGGPGGRGQAGAKKRAGGGAQPQAGSRRRRRGAARTYPAARTAYPGPRTAAASGRTWSRPARRTARRLTHESRPGSRRGRTGQAAVGRQLWRRTLPHSAATSGSGPTLLGRSPPARPAPRLTARIAAPSPTGGAPALEL